MTERRPRGGQRSRELVAILGIAGLQIVCAAVFVEQLVSSIFGLRSAPISWTWRETIEIMAALGLVTGMVLAAVIVRMVLRQRQRARDGLRALSGDFHAMIEEQFSHWGLTPSEREVALFMLKGFANNEIAALRNTSPGTIKAQTTAVFRKAGVSGRPQLLSHFIEELLDVPQGSVESAGRGKEDAA